MPEPQPNDNDADSELQNVQPSAAQPDIDSLPAPEESTTEQASVSWKRFFNLKVLIVTLLIVSSITAGAFFISGASSDNANQATNEVDGIEVSLTADTLEPDIADTLNLALTVQNNRNSTFTWDGSSTCEGDSIEDTEGNIISSEQICTQDLRTYELMPGESKTYQHRVQASKYTGCVDMVGIFNDFRTSPLRICPRADEVSEAALSTCKSSPDYEAACTQLRILFRGEETSLEEARAVLARYGLEVIQQRMLAYCEEEFQLPYSETLGTFWANVPGDEAVELVADLSEDTEISIVDTSPLAPSLFEAADC